MWCGTSPQIGRLRSLAEEYSPEDPFENAQKMTVRLRGVMVREDKDGMFRGGNDLMVVTKFQIGNEPPVERLHFMQKNAKLGWHGDFFNDIVYSTQDFSGKRLTLQLRVYDVDNVNEALIGSAEQLAKQAAGLFPQLAPYLGIVDFAVGPLVELVDNIDDHDEILDEQVTLEVPQAGRKGQNALKPGYVVCTKDSIEPECTLGSDLQIRNPDGNPLEECSYAVFGLLRDDLVDREYEINQRVAKLIAELKGKGQSGRSPIYYLQETLDAYSRFQKLQRAYELQSLETRTDAQERLLKDLKSDPQLEDYLGTN